MDKNKITFTTTYSQDDGEWVGTCDAYPSLSHLDADKEAAMAGILRLVADELAYGISQNVTVRFIADKIEANEPVTVFTTNQAGLAGRIVDQDDTGIILALAGVRQVIMKHAIVSIMPQAKVQQQPKVRYDYGT